MVDYLSTNKSQKKSSTASNYSITVTAVAYSSTAIMPPLSKTACSSAINNATAF